MISSLVAALAAAAMATFPSVSFVPHDGAVRFAATDLDARGQLPALRRALTTSIPFDGQFGVGFGIEEELRVDRLPSGALRVTVPGPCPSCAAAVPFASPEALAEGVSAAAATLVASGASALAGEARAYADALARDPAYRRAEWGAQREAWLRTARDEPADGPERLPVAASYRVIALPSGYLRFASGHEVQELDPAGKLRRVVNAAGIVREVRRDLAGRIVGIVDGHGRGLRFELDEAGHVVRATASGGRVARYGYDAAGRLAWSVGPGDDGRTEYVWDVAGRLVRVEGEGRVAVVTYQPAAEGGRVTSLEDSGGARERYAYQVSAGGLFRAVAVHPLDDDQDAADDAQEDDPAAEPAPGELRRYTFVEPLTSDGRRWTWQATEEVDGSAKVTIYDDRSFQPVSVSGSDRVARLEYDDLGRPVRKELPDETTALEYGPWGKVSRVTRSPKGGPDQEPTLEIRYAYDDRGRLVSARGLDAGVRLTYDAWGRMETLVSTKGGAERKLVFAYDENDRPARIVQEGVGELIVSYTDGGDVKKAESPGGRSIAVALTSGMAELLDLIRPAEAKPDVW